MKKIIILLLALTFLTSCGLNPPEPTLSPQGASRVSVSSGGIPDFDALRQEDPNTCAWLYIPGTQISFPVVSLSPEETAIETSLRLDNTRNNPDCSDPVVVLAGTPLHALQGTFLSEDALTAYPTLTLYTPAGTLSYQTFACGAYSNKDILRNFLSFKNTENIPLFVNQFLTYHTMIRVADDSVSVSSSDRILVLSAPLSTDSSQNFLVLAYLNR